MNKNFRLRSFFLILSFFLSSSLKLKALPLPFDFLLKPYVGVVFKPYTYSNSGTIASSNAFFNSFYKFENVELNAGLRVHKYFGVELFLTRFNYKFTNQTGSSIFNAFSFGLDLKLYYQFPFLDFLDIIGTSLELYGGIGMAYFNTRFENTVMTKTDSVVPKYSAGIQIRLLGAVSIRTGVDFYQLNLSTNPIGIGNILVYNIGFHYYFL